MHEQTCFGREARPRWWVSIAAESQKPRGGGTLHRLPGHGALMNAPLGILLVLAALVALPGSSAAQRSLNVQSVRGRTRRSDPGALRWRPSLPFRLSGPIAPALRVTVLSGALPAPPRLGWRGSDVALASVFTAFLLADAGQTRGLAREGWGRFREANPLLGPRPGVARVDVYTAVAGLSVLGVAAALPRRLRPWLLGCALGVEAVAVAGNARRGIAFRP